MPAVELAVGETETLDVSQYFSDPDGDALTYTATSSNVQAATVSVSGSAVTVTATARGVVTITVTARDPGGLLAQATFTVTVPNRAPVAVDAVPAQTIFVGATAQVDLAPYFEDPDGDALIYSAATANAAAVSVSVSGSVVSISAIAVGTTSMTVTATDPDGLSARHSFQVTVPNRAPAASGSIPPLTMAVGATATVDMAGYFTDPDGDTLTYTASSSNAGVAGVAVSGATVVVTAAGAGGTTVTVTARDPGGAIAQQRFRVTVQGAGGSLTITRVEPTVLLEGASATIRGSGFDRFSGNNTVVIDGLRATVTAASSTSLSITVPRADCLPPRRTELRVTASGGSAARTVGVTPLSREDIDLPRGHYKRTRPGDGCLHLPGDAAGGDYLIGVLSTSEDPSTLTPVTMRAIPGDPTVAAARGQAVAAQAGRALEAYEVANVPLAAFPPPPATGLPFTPAGQAAGPQRNWERHNEIIESSRETLSRLGPLPPSAGAGQARAVAASDTVTVFAGGNDWRCRSRGQVRAVVRFVGDHTAWLDDIGNPSGTFTDSELAALDAFYAAQVKPVHDRYFGPLSDVDNNSRVWILMTKEVNRDEGSLGWVWPSDLYSRSACPTSNQVEIFFGLVPDPNGIFGDAWTRQQVLEQYPSLLTHEITHLVQARAEIFGSARRQTIWESEGGATVSEELVAYRLFGHGSGRNLGYAEYVAGNSFYKWVADLLRFFGWDSDAGPAGQVDGAPEQCSWMGENDGPCKGGRAAYGVPSLVFRYAMDRWGGEYPGGESALMRRLTQSPGGLAALEEVSSWRRERILAEFYMGLWLDGRPHPDGGVWNIFSTWSIHEVIGGLRQVRFRPRPWTSSSARFEGRWNVRAGSSFALRWTPAGSRGPTSLRVTLPSGAPVPGHISVWALRIR